MKKNNLFVIATGMFAAILLLTGCKNQNEKIVATWPDGSPQIVYTMHGKNDKAVKIGERRYYENGQLQCEKHYESKHAMPEGTWTFFYENGKTFAQGHFDAAHPLGTEWHLFTREGNDYETGADSVCVAELGEAENPATVFFYHDSAMTVRQFYSTGALRCQGMTVNGLREGMWQFYFANGSPQTEATFVGGKEEGTYTVYRENGVPYYRGQYKEGRRIGTWELYDEEANLMSTQDYGK